MKLLTGIATVAAVATVARAGDAPLPFVPPAVTGETAFLETFTGGLGGWIGSENDKYTGARPPRSPAIAARRSRRTPRAGRRERPADAIRPEDRAIARSRPARSRDLDSRDEIARRFLSHLEIGAPRGFRTISVRSGGRKASRARLPRLPATPPSPPLPSTPL